VEGLSGAVRAHPTLPASLSPCRHGRKKKRSEKKGTFVRKSQISRGKSGAKSILHGKTKHSPLEKNPSQSAQKDVTVCLRQPGGKGKKTTPIGIRERGEKKEGEGREKQKRPEKHNTRNSAASTPNKRKKNSLCSPDKIVRGLERGVKLVCNSPA